MTENRRAGKFYQVYFLYAAYDEARENSRCLTLIRTRKKKRIV
jgi:hypothetical protein